MPARIIDVNLMGTLAVLDWARRAAGLAALRSMSAPARSTRSTARTGPASRCRRTATWRRAGCTASPSSPPSWSPSAMARCSACRPPRCGCPRSTAPWTAPPRARDFRHVPNRIAHMALDGVRRDRRQHAGRRRRLYPRRGCGARPSRRCCGAGRLRHSVYNMASGEVTTIGELIGWAAEKVPGLRAEIAPAEQADILQDATLPRRHVGRLRHLAASWPRPAGARARCARRSTPTWTGSRPNAPPRG